MTFVINKAYIILENLLITESNIFEFNNIIFIEKYKNILLKKLSNINDKKTKNIIIWNY